MDELVTVRLTGHAAAFPVTAAARAGLRRWLDDARARLADDPDGDDVLRDLEAALGDRLAGEPAGPVGRERMDAILAAIGPVAADAPPPAPVPAGPPRGRFLCRIREGQDIAGVCTGLTAYTEISLDWMRTIFVLGTLVTGGVLGVGYLVLAFALPVVPTVAEYERRRDAPAAPRRVGDWLP